MRSFKDVGVLVPALGETENKDLRGLTPERHRIVDEIPITALKRCLTPNHVTTTEAPPAFDPPVARQQSIHLRHRLGFGITPWRSNTDWRRRSLTCNLSFDRGGEMASYLCQDDLVWLD